MTDSAQVGKGFEVRSDTDKLAPTILEVMEVAKSHGVDCWLNYGALLGMVRENRLLPWNNDAELTCWFDPDITEKFRSITDALNNKGYHTYFYGTLGAIGVRTEGVIVNVNCSWREGIYSVRPHETPSGERCAPITATVLYWIATFMGAYPGGVTGNRYLPLSIREFLKVTLVSGFRCLPIGVRRKLLLLCIRWSKRLGGQFQKTAIPAEYFDNLVMRDFHGSKVLVPENPENVLRFIYGEEWGIPKDDWSFYDEKNKPDSGVIFIDEIWDYGRMELI